MITVLIGKDGDNTSEVLEVTGIKNTIPVESFNGEIIYNDLTAKNKKIYDAFKSLFTNFKFGSVDNSPYSFYATFLTLTDSTEESMNLNYDVLSDPDKKIIDDFYNMIATNKNLN